MAFRPPQFHSSPAPRSHLLSPSSLGPQSSFFRSSSCESCNACASHVACTANHRVYTVVVPANVGLLLLPLDAHGLGTSQGNYILALSGRTGNARAAAGARFGTTRVAEMGPALQREQHFEGPKTIGLSNTHMQTQLVGILCVKKQYAEGCRICSARHQGSRESTIHIE